MLKPTMGKYFYINKKGIVGPFYCPLVKSNIYEVVEVKGNLVEEGDSISYWDPADMSRFLLFIVLFVKLYVLSNYLSFGFIATVISNDSEKLKYTNKTL